MSETPQPNPAEMHPHLEQYPDAIQDVEKAHAMAIAGDAQRTHAADMRSGAGILIDQFENTELGRNIAGNIEAAYDAAIESDVTGPEHRRDIAGLTYATNALVGGGRPPEQAIEHLGKEISRAEDSADNAETEAAARVDKAREMRKSLGL